MNKSGDQVGLNVSGGPAGGMMNVSNISEIAQQHSGIRDRTPEDKENLSFLMNIKENSHVEEERTSQVQALRERITEEFVESAHALKQREVDSLRSLEWPAEEIEKKKKEFDARRKEGMRELRAYFKKHQGEGNIALLKEGATVIMNKYLLK